MKRFLLLAAAAVLTVFIAVSCAPDASETNYNWKNVNKQYDPANTTSVANPSISAGFTESDNGNIWVTLTFPERADVLKKKSVEDIEKELKTFLSFHTFSNPVDIDWQDKGVISILDDAISYKVYLRQGANITIEVVMSYSAVNSALFPISWIAKFDGQKYTYANGQKMDVDRNEIGGEAVYDDLYLPNGGYGPLVFYTPGHRGWYVFLPDLPSNTSLSGQWPTTTSTTTSAVDFTAAYIYLNGLNTTTSESSKAIHKEIADILGSSIKLQKFSGSSWTDVSAAVYSPTDTDAGGIVIGVDRLFFKNVTLEHNTRYRIRWTGNTHLQSNSTYFGVKQRIYISGNSPTSANNKQRYNFTDVVSATTAYTNAGIVPTAEITASPVVEVYSQNFNGNNVIIKLTFPIIGTSIDHASDPYVGLSQLSKEEFKKAFKIVYRRGVTGNWDITTPGVRDVIYVDIDDVKFAAEGRLPDDSANNTNLNNVVYITLNENYVLSSATRGFNFLINDGLKYTGTIARVFGNRAQILYEDFIGYRQYQAALPPPFSYLALDTWANGNIPVAGDDQWFRFTATAATQYFHFYADTLSSVNIQLYNESITATVGAAGAFTFSASQAGIVGTRSTGRTLTPGQVYYIRLTNTTAGGSYYIKFNASSAAVQLSPSGATNLDESQWTNGSIPAGNREQWFSFTATAATQYFHFSPGTLTDVYYNLYDSNMTAVTLNRTNLFGANLVANNSLALTPGQTYYVRVFPYGTSSSGNYRIAFTASATVP